VLEIVVINVDDECVPSPKNSKKVVDDVNRKFQKIWDMKMLWVEPIFNEVGLRKEKILVVRLDFIDKHPNKKKGFDKWIMDPKCMHVKNEIFMFNFLQPLSFDVIFKQWRISENLFNLQLFLAC